MNESDRVAALAAYQLLDTREEAAYDAFTEIARYVMGTAIAAIGFIDDRREWFKSHPGLNAEEVPREVALCTHVVTTQRTMVVPDTLQDDRFRDNPLVTGTPHVRFYAGVPLITPEGYTIGTLCAIDDKPHDAAPEQIQMLEALARALLVVLEARRRFRTIFDVANVDALTIDPSNDVVLFGSRAAREHLGYSIDEFRGTAASDVFPAFSPADVLDWQHRLRAGEKIIMQTEMRRRDGSTYPIELRVDLTYEQNSARLLAIAFDLTERKAREREISLLLEAINVAGDVILVYSMDASGELRLSYMNDAYTLQSGYSRAEAIGRNLQSFRAAMPDDEGMRAVRGAIAAGSPVQAEIVSYRKDGSTFWNQVTLHPMGDGSGKITHWISIERDVTQEVARSSALAEEHDRVLALTRAARLLFTALDARSLVETVRSVVRELLSAHARVLAVSHDERSIEVQELGNVDWTDAFQDDLVSQSVQYQMRTTAQKRDRAVTYVGGFGDARYVIELRAHASHVLRNADLFVFDLIAEYFQVAARNVALYRELEERRSAVLELSQTKSDLIAMLAHDFRGPLTTIVGFSDLIAELGEINGDQKESLDAIKRSALQLAELATDTLTLSRLERNEVSLQFGDVDVESLLASIIDQEAGRRIVHLRSSGNVHVAADIDRLRQVFANVIDNAIKYSPNGTSPDVEVNGTGESVIVSVRDCGIGIPAAEVGRIFDRFTRASNARKMRIGGTGFGLFLTKQLIQLHGGTIAAESAEGSGTTITATLPRQPARRALSRTVIVLDRELDGSFIADGIREAGYHAIAVAALDEVPAIAGSQPVDALIVAMPNGELTAADTAALSAFGRERSIPIVAIGDQPVARLGAYATLPRPVLVSDVVATLGMLLRSRNR
ncbi:MAG: PAS domain S-box protein [Candidatus Eremiobacteraeota bacterium]|nr:PAS domain S-box protein [Candidatus Eremiobacteraeota bacterium]